MSIAHQSEKVNVPTWFTLTPSDTVAESKGCRGFEVWAAGTVKWQDTTDYVQAQTFAAPFPVRVTGHIRNVWSTGTSLNPTPQSTITEIVGLR